MRARALFSVDAGGWMVDAALLERLVAERMEREATAAKPKGGDRRPQRDAAI